MNAGGPPPPPPPPPIPGVIPSSRLPSEIPNRPVAMNQPPAALAGAMMKDRKPFTYTPGGLDLSEISNQYQPNHNGDNIDQGPNSADFGVPVQSRSFRVLQNVLDHHDTAEPQGPIHIPNMRPAQQHSQHQPQPNQYQQQPPQPLYQHQSGVNNAASTEQTVPEPKKYMGSNIPSRSFRMLQAMTGSDDVAGPGQSDL